MRSKLYLVHVGESKDPHEDDGFPPGMLTLSLCPPSGGTAFSTPNAEAPWSVSYDMPLVQCYRCGPADLKVYGAHLWASR